jgi:hypothetical protein
MEQRDVMLTVIWVSIGCGVLFGVAIGAVVCWFLSKWNGRIPVPHRTVAPWQIWIQLVPFFGVISTLFVYPGMANSFEAHFRAKGEPAPSARGLAMAYCAVLLVLIPVSAVQIAINPVYRGEMPAGLPSPGLLVLQLLGGLLSILALVLWILVLVRFHGLQKRIPGPGA